MRSRVLVAMAVPCLSAFLALADAREAQAAGPSGTAGVSLQQKIPAGGGVATYEIKAAGTVTGLPANTTAVLITVEFKKKPAGKQVAATFLTINIQAPPAQTVPYDTGWQALTPDPAPGDDYNATVTVTYTAGGKTYAMVPFGSSNHIVIAQPQ